MSVRKVDARTEDDIESGYTHFVQEFILAKLKNTNVILWELKLK